MSVLVAKRYVKALLDQRDIEDITKIQDQLNTISSAYSDDKFLAIVSSIEVEVGKKVELILSFVENPTDVIKNLIDLLGKNRRLDIIPDITNELNTQVAQLKNSYVGVVYSNTQLSQEYLTSMEESFSKKFNVNLTLNNEVGSYDGIKVDIDGLGVEIGFSQERLRSQMIEHILKAV